MRIAILTNFDNFRSGYSLTGLVLDQWRMLTAHGHDVTIFTNKPCEIPDFVPEDCAVDQVFPPASLIDYGVDQKYPSCDSLTPEHDAFAEEVAGILEQELKTYDLILTHDWIFTGWNLPYSEAVRRADEFLGASWLHWVHSMPLVVQDWHCYGRYGTNHKIIFPTTINRQFIADQFETEMENVRIIPHIKDPRRTFKLGPEAERFLNKHKHILQADICQVYPVGTDRLTHKGVREVILMFSTFKRMKRKVCLILANSWATGRLPKQSLDHFKRMVVRNGLRWGKDVIATSEFEAPAFEIGIPEEMVLDLFRFSNVFIYPTVVESFGLVLVEALQTGGIWTVCNRNVDSMFEVAGGTGLFAEFPSYRTADNYEYPAGERKYFDRLAKQVVARLEQDVSILGKTRAIQTYNWENLYHRYYEPLLAESMMWG